MVGMLELDVMLSMMASLSESSSVELCAGMNPEEASMVMSEMIEAGMTEMVLRVMPQLEPSLVLSMLLLADEEIMVIVVEALSTESFLEMTFVSTTAQLMQMMVALDVETQARLTIAIMAEQPDISTNLCNNMGVAQTTLVFNQLQIQGETQLLVDLLITLDISVSVNIMSSIDVETAQGMFLLIDEAVVLQIAAAANTPTQLAALTANMPADVVTTVEAEVTVSVTGATGLADAAILEVALTEIEAAVDSEAVALVIGDLDGLTGAAALESVSLTVAAGAVESLAESDAVGVAMMVDAMDSTLAINLLLSVTSDVFAVVTENMEIGALASAMRSTSTASQAAIAITSLSVSVQAELFIEIGFTETALILGAIEGGLAGGILGEIALTDLETSTGILVQFSAPQAAGVLQGLVLSDEDTAFTLLTSLSPGFMSDLLVETSLVTIQTMTARMEVTMVVEVIQSASSQAQFTLLFTSLTAELQLATFTEFTVEVQTTLLVSMSTSASALLVDTLLVSGQTDLVVSLLGSLDASISVQITVLLTVETSLVLFETFHQATIVAMAEASPTEALLTQLTDMMPDALAADVTASIDVTFTLTDVTTQLTEMSLLTETDQATFMADVSITADQGAAIFINLGAEAASSLINVMVTNAQTDSLDAMMGMMGADFTAELILGLNEVTLPALTDVLTADTLTMLFSGISSPAVATTLVLQMSSSAQLLTMQTIGMTGASELLVTLQASEASNICANMVNDPDGDPAMAGEVLGMVPLSFAVTIVETVTAEVGATLITGVSGSVQAQLLLSLSSDIRVSIAGKLTVETVGSMIASATSAQMVQIVQLFSVVRQVELLIFLDISYTTSILSTYTATDLSAIFVEMSLQGFNSQALEFMGSFDPGLSCQMITILPATSATSLLELLPEPLAISIGGGCATTTQFELFTTVIPVAVSTVVEVEVTVLAIGAASAVNVSATLTEISGLQTSEMAVIVSSLTSSLEVAAVFESVTITESVGLLSSLVFNSETIGVAADGVAMMDPGLAVQAILGTSSETILSLTNELETSDLSVMVLGAGNSVQQTTLLMSMSTEVRVTVFLEVELSVSISIISSMEPSQSMALIGDLFNSDPMAVTMMIRGMSESASADLLAFMVNSRQIDLVIAILAGFDSAFATNQIILMGEQASQAIYQAMPPASLEIIMGSITNEAQLVSMVQTMSSTAQVGAMMTMELQQQVMVCGSIPPAQSAGMLQVMVADGDMEEIAMILTNLDPATSCQILISVNIETLVLLFDYLEVTLVVTISGGCTTQIQFDFLMQTMPEATLTVVTTEVTIVEWSSVDVSSFIDAAAGQTSDETAAALGAATAEEGASFFSLVSTSDAVDITSSWAVSGSTEAAIGVFGAIEASVGIQIFLSSSTTTISFLTTTLDSQSLVRIISGATNPAQGLLVLNTMDTTAQADVFASFSVTAGTEFLLSMPGSQAGSVLAMMASNPDQLEVAAQFLLSAPRAQTIVWLESVSPADAGIMLGAAGGAAAFDILLGFSMETSMTIITTMEVSFRIEMISSMTASTQVVGLIRMMDVTAQAETLVGLEAAQITLTLESLTISESVVIVQEIITMGNVDMIGPVCANMQPTLAIQMIVMLSTEQCISVFDILDLPVAMAIAKAASSQAQLDFIIGCTSGDVTTSIESEVTVTLRGASTVVDVSAILTEITSLSQIERLDVMVLKSTLEIAATFESLTTVEVVSITTGMLLSETVDITLVVDAFSQMDAMMASQTFLSLPAASVVSVTNAMEIGHLVLVGMAAPTVAQRTEFILMLSEETRISFLTTLSVTESVTLITSMEPVQQTEFLMMLVYSEESRDIGVSIIQSLSVESSTLLIQYVVNSGQIQQAVDLLTFIDCNSALVILINVGPSFAQIIYTVMPMDVLEGITMCYTSVTQLSQFTYTMSVSTLSMVMTTWDLSMQVQFCENMDASRSGFLLDEMTLMGMDMNVLLTSLSPLTTIRILDAAKPSSVSFFFESLDEATTITIVSSSTSQFMLDNLVLLMPDALGSAVSAGVTLPIQPGPQVDVSVLLGDLALRPAGAQAQLLLEVSVEEAATVFQQVSLSQSTIMLQQMVSLGSLESVTSIMTTMSYGAAGQLFLASGASTISSLSLVFEIETLTRIVLSSGTIFQQASLVEQMDFAAQGSFMSTVSLSQAQGLIINMGASARINVFASLAETSTLRASEMLIGLSISQQTEIFSGISITGGVQILGAMPPSNALGFILGAPWELSRGLLVQMELSYLQLIVSSASSSTQLVQFMRVVDATTQYTLMADMEITVLGLVVESFSVSESGALMDQFISNSQTDTVVTLFTSLRITIVIQIILSMSTTSCTTLFASFDESQMYQLVMGCPTEDLQQRMLACAPAPIIATLTDQVTVVPTGAAAALDVSVILTTMTTMTVTARLEYVATLSTVEVAGMCEVLSIEESGSILQGMILQMSPGSEDMIRAVFGTITQRVAIQILLYSSDSVFQMVTDSLEANVLIGMISGAPTTAQGASFLMRMSVETRIIVLTSIRAEEAALTLASLAPCDIATFLGVMFAEQDTKMLMFSIINNINLDLVSYIIDCWVANGNAQLAADFLSGYDPCAGLALFSRSGEVTSQSILNTITTEGLVWVTSCYDLNYLYQFFYLLDVTQMTTIIMGWEFDRQVAICEGMDPQLSVNVLAEAIAMGEAANAVSVLTRLDLSTTIQILDTASEEIRTAAFLEMDESFIVGLSASVTSTAQLGRWLISMPESVQTTVNAEVTVLSYGGPTIDVSGILGELDGMVAEAQAEFLLEKTTEEVAAVFQTASIDVVALSVDLMVQNGNAEFVSQALVAMNPFQAMGVMLAAGDSSVMYFAEFFEQTQLVSMFTTYTSVPMCASVITKFNFSLQASLFADVTFSGAADILFTYDDFGISQVFNSMDSYSVGFFMQQLSVTRMISVIEIMTIESSATAVASLEPRTAINALFGISYEMCQLIFAQWEDDTILQITSATTSSFELFRLVMVIDVSRRVTVLTEMDISTRGMIFASMTVTDLTLTFERTIADVSVDVAMEFFFTLESTRGLQLLISMSVTSCQSLFAAFDLQQQFTLARASKSMDELQALLGCADEALRTQIETEVIIVASGSATAVDMIALFAGMQGLSTTERITYASSLTLVQGRAMCENLPFAESASLFEGLILGDDGSNGAIAMVADTLSGMQTTVVIQLLTVISDSQFILVTDAISEDYLLSFISGSSSVTEGLSIYTRLSSETLVRVTNVMPQSDVVFLLGSLQPCELAAIFEIIYAANADLAVAVFQILPVEFSAFLLDCFNGQGNNQMVADLINASDPCFGLQLFIAISSGTRGGVLEILTIDDLIRIASCSFDIYYIIRYMFVLEVSFQSQVMMSLSLSRQVGLCEGMDTRSSGLLLDFMVSQGSITEVQTVLVNINFKTSVEILTVARRESTTLVLETMETEVIILMLSASTNQAQLDWLTDAISDDAVRDAVLLEASIANEGGSTDDVTSLMEGFDTMTAEARAAAMSEVTDTQGAAIFQLMQPQFGGDIINLQTAGGNAAMVGGCMAQMNPVQGLYVFEAASATTVQAVTMTMEVSSLVRIFSAAYTSAQAIATIRQMNITIQAAVFVDVNFLWADAIMAAFDDIEATSVISYMEVNGAAVTLQKFSVMRISRILGLMSADVGGAIVAALPSKTAVTAILSMNSERIQLIVGKLSSDIQFQLTMATGSSTQMVRFIGYLGVSEQFNIISQMEVATGMLVFTSMSAKSSALLIDQFIVGGQTDVIIQYFTSMRFESSIEIILSMSTTSCTSLFELFEESWLLLLFQACRSTSQFQLLLICASDTVKTNLESQVVISARGVSAIVDVTTIRTEFDALATITERLDYISGRSEQEQAAFCLNMPQEQSTSLLTGLLITGEGNNMDMIAAVIKIMDPEFVNAMLTLLTDADVAQVTSALDDETLGYIITAPSTTASGANLLVRMTEETRMRVIRYLSLQQVAWILMSFQPCQTAAIMEVIVDADPGLGIAILQYMSVEYACQVIQCIVDGGNVAAASVLMGGVVPCMAIDIFLCLGADTSIPIIMEMTIEKLIEIILNCFFFDFSILIRFMMFLPVEMQLPVMMSWEIDAQINFCEGMDVGRSVDLMQFMITEGYTTEVTTVLTVVDTRIAVELIDSSTSETQTTLFGAMDETQTLAIFTSVKGQAQFDRLIQFIPEAVQTTVTSDVTVLDLGGPDVDVSGILTEDFTLMAPNARAEVLATLTPEEGGQIFQELPTQDSADIIDFEVANGDAEMTAMCLATMNPVQGGDLIFALSVTSLRSVTSFLPEPSLGRIFATLITTQASQMFLLINVTLQATLLLDTNFIIGYDIVDGFDDVTAAGVISTVVQTDLTAAGRILSRFTETRVTRITELMPLEDAAVVIPALGSRQPAGVLLLTNRERAQLTIGLMSDDTLVNITESTSSTGQALQLFGSFSSERRVAVMGGVNRATQVALCEGMSVASSAILAEDTVLQGDTQMVAEVLMAVRCNIALRITITLTTNTQQAVLALVTEEFILCMASSATSQTQLTTLLDNSPEAVRTNIGEVAIVVLGASAALDPVALLEETAGLSQPDLIAAMGTKTPVEQGAMCEALPINEAAGIASGMVAMGEEAVTMVGETLATMSETVIVQMFLELSTSDVDAITGILETDDLVRIVRGAATAAQQAQLLLAFSNTTRALAIGGLSERESGLIFINVEPAQSALLIQSLFDSTDTQDLAARFARSASCDVIVIIIEYIVSTGDVQFAVDFLTYLADIDGSYTMCILIGLRVQPLQLIYATMDTTTLITISNAISDIELIEFMWTLDVSAQTTVIMDWEMERQMTFCENIDATWASDITQELLFLGETEAVSTVISGLTGSFSAQILDLNIEFATEFFATASEEVVLEIAGGAANTYQLDRLKASMPEALQTLVTDSVVIEDWGAAAADITALLPELEGMAPTAQADFLAEKTPEEGGAFFERVTAGAAADVVRAQVVAGGAAMVSECVAEMSTRTARLVLMNTEGSALMSLGDSLEMITLQELLASPLAAPDIVQANLILTEFTTTVQAGFLNSIGAINGAALLFGWKPNEVRDVMVAMTRNSEQVATAAGIMLEFPVPKAADLLNQFDITDATKLVGAMPWGSLEVVLACRPEITSGIVSELTVEQLISVTTVSSSSQILQLFYFLTAETQIFIAESLEVRRRVQLIESVTVDKASVLTEGLVALGVDLSETFVGVMPSAACDVLVIILEETATAILATFTEQQALDVANGCFSQASLDILTVRLSADLQTVVTEGVYLSTKGASKQVGDVAALLAQADGLSQIALAELGMSLTEVEVAALCEGMDLIQSTGLFESMLAMADDFTMILGVFGSMYERTAIQLLMSASDESLRAVSGAMFEASVDSISKAVTGGDSYIMGASLLVRLDISIQAGVVGYLPYNDGVELLSNMETYLASNVLVAMYNDVELKARAVGVLEAMSLQTGGDVCEDMMNRGYIAEAVGLLMEVSAAQSIGICIMVRRETAQMITRQLTLEQVIVFASNSTSPTQLSQLLALMTLDIRTSAIQGLELQLQINAFDGMGSLDAANVAQSLARKGEIAVVVDIFAGLYPRTAAQVLFAASASLCRSYFAAAEESVVVTISQRLYHTGAV